MVVHNKLPLKQMLLHFSFLNWKEKNQIISDSSENFDSERKVAVDLPYPPEAP